MNKFVKKNIGLSLLFSVLTCGIYAVYWQYVLIENLKAVKGDDSNSFVKLLCCIFIPFFILYWWYKTGESLRTELAKKNVSTNGGIVYLVLCILGLEILAKVILQNEFNTEFGEFSVVRNTIGGEVVSENKYSRFRRSKLNGFLNILEVFLFVALGLFAFLTIAAMFVLLAATMWGGDGYNDISRPINLTGFYIDSETDGKTYFNVNSESVYYIDKYENGKLFWQYSCHFDVSDFDDWEIVFNNDSYDSVIFDGETVTDLENFVAEKGVHDLVIYQSQNVPLDVYKKCKIVSVEFLDYKYYGGFDTIEIEYSNEFKVVKEKNEASNSISFYTPDSEGKFVPYLERTFVFKTTKVLFFVNCGYILFLIGKGVFLHFAIKKSSTEKQK